MGSGRALAAATATLAARALRQWARRPQLLAPLVLFPTLLLAANTGGLEGATRLPGFPEVRGLLDFQLSAALLQSLLLMGTTTGIATALDVESGFFDRLVASPASRLALVTGRLAAAAAVSLVQITWFLGIGFAFGAQVAGGVLGVLVVVAIALLAAVGFGAIGVSLAFRARSAAAVQAVFPLVLVLLFASSAFFPRGLLQEPSRALATYNPLSYLGEGMRGAIIGPVEAGPTLAGLAAGAAIAVVGVLLALWTLRGRLRDA